MTTLELPERPRILVITLRRLGDVLLTTPLIRTIRRGFPQATLDMLVFRDTEDILRGNPDIDNIVSMPARPSAGETLSLVRSLWRQYDLAVSTQAGDRPTFFALVARWPSGHPALGPGHCARSRPRAGYRVSAEWDRRRVRAADALRRHAS
jgi:heptosyltransferase-3